MIEVLQIVEYKREIRKKCMMAAPKGTLTFRRWNEEDKPIEETEKEEQQKYQICALEASLRLLQGGPERRARLPERRLEGLRRELQGLGSQVQERARAQIQTGPQKCKATSGLHRELRNEQQLPWEEPEMLREEQKLLQGQLSRHPVLLLKPKTEGRHSGRTRWGSSRGTPFLTRSPAAFSSRPRALSGTTHSLRAPRCS
ncbi:uncharacterized protein [Tursiops truncatus]|uniref:Transmembrane protein CCDC163 n=1 Tax=Tursiops truncatus TaxID=9739 RepID=A0A6J3S810_TURTR|nr:transmembrane protein CCDC163 [Tursiops truncatus]